VSSSSTGVPPLAHFHLLVLFPSSSISHSACCPTESNPICGLVVDWSLVLVLYKQRRGLPRSPACYSLRPCPAGHVSACFSLF
jgi:hypothetical protein